MRRLAHVSVVVGALLATASAAVLGEPGVASQYQLFPHQQTVIPTTNLAVGEGEVQQADATAKGKAACEKDHIFSEVFKKCLPAPGKDGFIGQNVGVEQIGRGNKGKGVAETVVPIESLQQSETIQPLIVQPLRQNSYIRSAPLTADTIAPAQPAQQPAQPAQAGPQQPAPPVAQPGQPGQPGLGSPRQLRLACPTGFSFQPALGACIAPIAGAPQAMYGPQAQAMFRGRRRDDDDDDDDDDEDRFRRELFRRGLRHRFHKHILGRRRGFGRPQILAPVFVFVLPSLTGRNETRSGQRVYEIHPSLVGGPTRKPEATTASKPIAGAEAQPKPKESEIGGEAKPKEIEATEQPKPKGTAAEAEPKPKGATATEAEPKPKGAAATEAEPKPKAGPIEESPKPKALRGAFVNPIVGSGTTVAPLMSERDTIAGSDVQPLRVDSGVDDRSGIADVGALRDRVRFISPVISSASL